FDGRLPRTAPVGSFLTRANAMSTHPEFFTLTRAWAVHRAMTDLDCDGAKPPNYGSLNEEQRQLLCKLEEDLLQAFVERLVRGSSFGSLLWLASTVLRLTHRSKQDSRAASGTSPKHLAEEYSAISERVPIKGRRLATTFDLLAELGFSSAA